MPAPLTQGDHLMAAKASRQSSADNTGPRDTNYHLYDNDANFDPRLSSNSAEYVRNIDTDNSAEMTVDRWQTGGGIDVGDSVNFKPGGFKQDERSRDDDGTIDRVKDPPKALLPLLYAIKAQCEAYNVDLHGAFVDGGGTRFGMISTTRFCSVLVSALNRMNLDEDACAALVAAYGCGCQVDERSRRFQISKHESCAWKDLCEDVGKAEPDKPYDYPYGGPPPFNGC